MGQTYSRNDRVIKAKVGEEFSIALDSVAGAGYQWDAEFDGEQLELVDKNFDAPPAIGGTGKDVLSFRPTAGGETTLRLVYRRPWEAGSEEMVEVTVKSSE